MAGKRIALVLDIGFGALLGSERSAARMSDLLERRGYQVTGLRGEEVVRERVLAEIIALGRHLEAGDSFVFYFVGHGEKLRGAAGAAPVSGGPPLAANVMLLITHDLFETQDPPCPGIAGPELVEWLEPIAERTGEVTILLDCCHAATMTAGVAPVDAAARTRIEDVLVSAAPTLRAKYGVPSRSTASEAAIVRVIASKQNEYAVERVLDDQSGRIGVFTDSLVALLDRHADADLSWDELLPELQTMVQAESEAQHPGVEGARHRVPFSRRERPPLDTYPLRASRDGWVLQAGALHGVAIGERFSVGAAVVCATEVGLDTARLEPVGDVLPPALAQARRITCPDPLRICWPIAPAVPSELAAGVEQAPELLLVGPDDPDAGARVEADAAGLALRDDAGEVVHSEPGEWTPHAAHRLLQAMRRVARWRRQSAVLAGLAASAPIYCAWGLVDDPEPLPADGAELHAGDRVWVRVWSTGARPEVFVSLFHLRADRSLVHCDADLDHGFSVARNRSVDLTLTAGGGERPIELAWCEQVPRDGPHSEALVLVASTDPPALHRVATSTSVELEVLPDPGARGLSDTREVTAVILRYRLLPDGRQTG